MDTLNQQIYSKNINKFALNKDSSYKTFSSCSNPNLCKNSNNVLNQFRLTNEKNSTSADSYSYQNYILSYENSKSFDASIQKDKNERLNDLFATFGDKNELSNFSIFQQNVNINLNLNEKIIQKITLYEYFEGFIEASSFGVNIPFLDKKRNITYNIFNPTLSSMNLVIHQKKLKNSQIKNRQMMNNFSLYFINDDLIKLRFDENIPFYNREVIGNKINNVHKIFDKKNIILKDIDKEKSYFSILWTPSDIHIIKSSFLSVYSFDFKLIGTLIKKVDELNWLETFSADLNSKINKDFKKEYLENINNVDYFIKRCNGIDKGKKLNIELLSQDYRRFIYNY